MEGKQNKPVFETRVGSVRVSVWRNEDKQGNAFFNSTIVRRFKAGEDEWSSSNSYTGLSDLALLREAVELAQQFVRDHQCDTAEVN